MTLEGNHDEYYNDIVDFDPTDLQVVNKGRLNRSHGLDMWLFEEIL